MSGDRPLRVAMLLNVFPKVSETFVAGQVADLLAAGHHVDLFAQRPGDPAEPVHDVVRAYGLLERTVYVDERIPDTAGLWEMPSWPATGETWIPGEDRPVPNARRLAEAAPVVARCFAGHPDVTRRVLDPHEFGYQALSLSALYRLDVLRALGGSYDVCHAHFGPTGNAFRFTAELWRAPLVVSFYGYDMSSFVEEQGAGIYARLFDTASRVLAISRFSAARLRDVGCPPSKITVLPLGVDLDAFPFRARERAPGAPVRVLTVARLVPVKGVEFGIRAVHLLRRRGHDVRYDVVGEGPERARLEALVDELRLRDAVVLHGARDAAGVRELMATDDVFLLPSTRVGSAMETQGLVLQEAQASGMPVVATDTGGIGEGIDAGRSGLLVPDRRADAIADAVEVLLARAGDWPAMGRAGRRLVERRFDRRRLVEQLVGVYRDALASAGAGGSTA